MAKKKPRPARKTRRRQPAVRREPLENLFMWNEDGRVIRNEELYLELIRAGHVLRPTTTFANDLEWSHDDTHGDESYHGDRTEHDDRYFHEDYKPIHVDDRGGEPDPGTSPPPPGGHGDRSGEHLDFTIPHGDRVGHFDSPPRHYDGPQHWDYHADRPYRGHWDVDHVDG